MVCYGNGRGLGLLSYDDIANVINSFYCVDCYCYVTLCVPLSTGPTYPDHIDMLTLTTDP